MTTHLREGYTWPADLGSLMSVLSIWDVPDRLPISRHATYDFTAPIRSLRASNVPMLGKVTKGRQRRVSGSPSRATYVPSCAEPVPWKPSLS